ncbi:MAG: PCMD domain-containing protein [Rikenellaceae bacterium]
MMRFFSRYYFALATTFAALFAAFALGSCIKNDIPYPHMELYITAVAGEGFTTQSIDNASRTVTLEVEEQSDIQALKITEASYTEGANLSREIVGTHDMRLNLTTSLYLYQRYDWTIVANQNIHREFKVWGQIGSERIDIDNRYIEVDVNENTVDLSNVNVTAMKLAASEITTYMPTIEALDGTSFETMRQIEVTTHGRSQNWVVKLIATTASTFITADVRATSAHLIASGDLSTPATCIFKYREAGATDWIDVTPAPEDFTATEYRATVSGLKELTEYQFIADASGVESEIATHTTEQAEQLPNSGFEDWHYFNDKIWFPYLSSDGADAFWGTGNEGSATAGYNVTTGDTSEVAPGSAGAKSAKLNSENVLVKFAAGNIFAGRFVEVNGTNGTISVGREFVQRPSALRGFAKYNQGVVTHSAGSSVPLQIGDMDQGYIWIALGDWDSPLLIDTRDASTFFNANTDPNVIAFGELLFDSSSDWSEFTIDLEYRDIARKPKYIAIVCTSSRYGDYFTGSSNSDMWVDDFQLLYE